MVHFTTRIILLFSACYISFSAYGQSAIELAPTTSDTTLLWEISNSETDYTSYLFGTMHMIPEEDYFLGAEVIEALNTSSQLTFEIDPRDMENPALIFQLINKINMNDNISLSDLLTAEEYKKVASYFEDSGMPMMLFERMKPLFLSAMVGQDLGDLSSANLNNGKIKSYELELSKMARAKDKEVSGLETMAFQLSLFDSIPYKSQAQMLLKAIESDQTRNESQGELDKMIDMYKRKAVAEMVDEITAETSELSRFEDLLLTRRNENWIEPMTKMMQEKSVLFAVGAGHLGGEKGVIALLRKSGYTVKPVYK